MSAIPALSPFPPAATDENAVPDVDLAAMSRKEGLNWPTTLVLVALHAGAVAALFLFNWQVFLVTALLYWICIGGGIGMGYHRLHTHRGYHVPRWLEYALAVCGTMTLEGGPIFWVATHRLHHQKSDREGDPHSPRDGAWWAHVGWIMLGRRRHNDTRQMAKYAPDLGKHRFYLWLNTYHYVPLLASVPLLAWLGYVWGGFHQAVAMVLWAVCARVVVGLHATWLVNSATHMWGQRRFATRDDSRNNWWVALLTFGEGWHNNHHAHPTSVRHGLAWYEADLTYWQIRMLAWLRIAKNLKVARVDSK
ncbi:MAG TPA: fatty acid desaturase [Terriglobales bacterium]|nr:fatty acid desaturase [Terriglobales bacterium]